MEQGSQSTYFALPPAVLAEVNAVAEREHRAAGDVVREAVERYLIQSRAHFPAASTGHAADLTAVGAVRRILEQRRGNVLPEGVTIRELMTYGRA